MHIGETDDYDLGSVFLPDQTSLTYADGTYSDYFYGSNGGNTVCYFGGHYFMGPGAGPFGLDFSAAASYAYATIGCRLAKE